MSVIGGTSDVLAIIPARGGSKRLPGKNSVLLAGKPMIGWTIEAAVNSRIANAVCVSTDDSKIMDIARSFGAEVPFVRPQTISEDWSTSADVVLHALEFYESTGQHFETVILLQPTSPLRTSAQIREAYGQYQSRKALSVTSVGPMEHSPLWANVLPDSNSLVGFVATSVAGKRAQELPVYYRLNGAIYIVNAAELKRTRSFIAPDRCFAYRMDSESSVDVDTALDLVVAEVILEQRRKSSSR